MSKNKATYITNPSQKGSWASEMTSHKQLSNRGGTKEHNKFCNIERFKGNTNFTSKCNCEFISMVQMQARAETMLDIMEISHMLKTADTDRMIAILTEIVVNNTNE